MKGNLGKEKAWRKWKMGEFQKNLHWLAQLRFAVQTPCRTGLCMTSFFASEWAYVKKCCRILDEGELERWAVPTLLVSYRQRTPNP
jgi:hypothetical protein